MGYGKTSASQVTYYLATTQPFGYLVVWCYASLLIGGIARVFDVLAFFVFLLGESLVGKRRDEGSIEVHTIRLDDAGIIWRLQYWRYLVYEAISDDDILYARVGAWPGVHDYVG
jgi:hypothetical protein